jgi:hypothetical protein
MSRCFCATQAAVSKSTPNSGAFNNFQSGRNAATHGISCYRSAHPGFIPCFMCEEWGAGNAVTAYRLHVFLGFRWQTEVSSRLSPPESREMRGLSRRCFRSFQRTIKVPAPSVHETMSTKLCPRNYVHETRVSREPSLGSLKADFYSDFRGNRLPIIRCWPESELLYGPDGACF